MRRLITRHGQVQLESGYSGGHLFPIGEVLLSEMGAEQARRLGMRLRAEDFNGVILCSPFARTLLTAELIAEETGLEVIPFAPIHEIFHSQESFDSLNGMTKEEIKEKFRFIAEDFELEYPWWPEKIETQADVEARVAEGVKLAEERYPGREILYVGHGATTQALHKVYGIPLEIYPFLFNCALSSVDDTKPEKTVVSANTDHLPYEMTTSNFAKKMDFDRDNMTKEYTDEIALPEWVTDGSAEILLHIGDTNSYDYPFYRALIDRVKPSILLHTGDMADEVKAGRKPYTKAEYIFKISVMCDMLDKSGAERVIIVPGNNDLKDEVASLIPRAEIYAPNTVIELSGEEYRIGHEVWRMKFDRRVSFYGHGYTGETWNYDSNKVGEECRFNAHSNSHIYDLKTGRFFRLDP